MTPDRTDQESNIDEEEANSSDEALLEMLGLNSLDSLVVEKKEADDESQSHDIPQVSESSLASLVESHGLPRLYQDESICNFPSELCISSAHMRRITDELVWGGKQYSADRTNETIKIWKQGEILERRTLTRLENFVNTHAGWNYLCRNYLRRCVSAVVGTEMVLYKEKLNLKPPGGSGFAPHLDSPSLRIALGPDGPQTFVTVMVAIDDMTTQNGCLRVLKGPWSEEHHCQVIQPEKDGNPDAGGRAGAIPIEAADGMDFEDTVVKGGSITIFNGWTPHRSSANTSPFPRRAVFLTYNPKSEGDFHDRYYQEMERKRTAWQESVGLANRIQREEDDKREMDFLDSVPKV
jgi:ectoine hydroxylase-related dioxygenase (phytanoyl-CoA dioxygenase family)